MWSAVVGHASRSPNCLYVGQIRLFFTACTRERALTFADPAVVAVVGSQLLNTCQRADVEVTAYCFMRDHVHALIAGKTDCAEIGAAIGRWKQVSGYWYRKQRSGRLWQVNYWDRVLRQRDHSGEVVRYILSDPIPVNYSTLSALTGSIFVALLAGR